MKPKPRLIMYLLAIVMCLGFSLGVYAKEDSVLSSTDSSFTGSAETAVTEENLRITGEDTKSKAINAEAVLSEENTEQVQAETEHTSAEAKKVSNSDENVTDKNEKKSDSELPKTEKTATTESSIQESSSEDKEQGQVQKQEVSKNSDYTVEFTRDDLQYVLQGNESVKLDKILKELKIEGQNVESVECSDETLFSASKKSGEWTVTSHKKFDSKEWMKVTIDGTLYNITVTDTVTDTNGAIAYTAYHSARHMIVSSSSNGVIPSPTVSTPVFDKVDISVIRSVGIKTGVSGINAFAFHDFSNLEVIAIPIMGSNKIGKNAFIGTPAGMHVLYYGSGASAASLTAACGGNLANAFPNQASSQFHYLATTGIGSDWYYGYDNSNQDLYIVSKDTDDMNDWATTQSPFYTNRSSLQTARICGCDSVIGSIGGAAFYSCSKLKNVYIYAEKLRTVNTDAFNSCSSLEKITLTESVDVMGIRAFYQCTALKSLSWKDGNGTVLIPNGVHIGERAFASSNSFQNIIIPSNLAVNAIEDDAFTTNNAKSNPVQVYYWGVDSTMDHLRNRCKSGRSGSFSSGTYNFDPESDVEIGTTNNWVYYIIVGDYAYVRKWEYGDQNTGIIKDFTTSNRPNWGSAKYVYFGEGTTVVGTNMFYDSDNLITVDMPEVTTIRGSAFKGCGKLTSATMPEAITICSNAFQSASSLSQIILANATTVDDYAFEQDTALTKAVLLKATSIGSYAFQDCTSLATVVIPNSVTTIGNSAFLRLKIGADIYYANTESNRYTPYTELASKCYIYYDTNGSFDFTEDPTTSGDYVFHFKCGDSLWYKIQNNTATISNDRHDSANLDMWAYGNASATYSPFNRVGSTLTGVSISDATSIGDYAFYSCTGITGTLTIPNSVTTIGTNAFYGCTSLQSVTIPTNVTSVGGYAFGSCSALATVIIYPNSSLSIANYAFRAINSNANIYFDGTYSGLNTVCGNRINRAFEVTAVYNSENESSPKVFHFKCGDNLWYTIQNHTATISKDIAPGPDFTMWNWSYASGSTSPFNKDASQFTSVVISDATTIGEYAFYHCTSLSKFAPSGVSASTGSVIIPNTITATGLGKGAFEECSGLTTLTFQATSKVTAISESAFRSCSGLTSVTLPSTVTTIGDTSFYGCTSLPSITIPTNVTSLGTSAFNGCSALATVIIYPHSSLSIGGTAFNSINSNANIYFAGTYGGLNTACSSGIGGRFDVTAVYNTDATAKPKVFHFKCGDNLWYTIQNNTATISKDIAQGSSVITMWNWNPANSNPSPFTSAASSFTSVSISDATTIGNYAFYNCTGITGPLTIPNSVTTIGTYAFYGCTSLTSVTIPTNVTSVGTSAFNGCGALATVIIYPNSSLSIGGTAFNSINSNANIYFDGTYGGLNTACSNGIGGRFDVSAVYNTNATAKPKVFHFKCGDNLWYTIQNHTATISKDIAPGPDFTMSNWTGSSASPFTDAASSFTSVSISDATTIGNYAFYNCTGITGTLTIPNSVTTIGTYAFYGCTSLTSVTIPTNVTSVGTSAFNGCSALATVIIYPHSSLSIGETAFASLKSGANIYYENTESDRYTPEATLESKCYGSALSGSFSTNLNYVYHFKCGQDLWYKIQNGTATISKDIATGSGLIMWAYGSSSATYSPFTRVASTLTGVSISDATSIGTYAFVGCTGLTNLSLANTITTIGTRSFQSCSALTSVNIPSSVTTLKDSCFKYSGLTSITIPGNVITIETGAFYGCSGLTSVTMENGVQTIGSSAFKANNNLATVIIPSSVTSIEKEAFFSMAAGADIYYENTESDRYTPEATLESKCYGSALSGSFSTNLSYVYHFKCGQDLWYTIQNGTATISNDFSIDDHLSMWGWGNTSETLSPFAREAATLTTVNIIDANEIGENAFYGCSNLADVVIPENVLGAALDEFLPAIKQNAFYGTPNNANFYCRNAYSKTNLATHCYNQTLTGAFPNAANQNFYFVCGQNVWYQVSADESTAVVSTVYPSDATNKDIYDFMEPGASGYDTSPFALMSETLTTVDLGVATRVGNAAFINCYNLTDVTVSNSVESIGYCSFSSCSALPSIIIPDSVTSIEENAFENCTALENIVISKNAADIGSSAFYGTPNDANFYCRNAYNKANLETHCNESDLENSFPNEANQNFYFGCGENLYYELSGTNDSVATISQVYPSNGSTIMDSWDPEDLDNPTTSPFVQMASTLTAVDFGSATTIGDHAFDGCSNLGDVVIPSTIANVMDGQSVDTYGIGFHAFYNIPSTTKIYYSNSSVDKADPASKLNSLCTTRTRSLNNIPNSFEYTDNIYYKCGDNLWYHIITETVGETTTVTADIIRDTDVASSSDFSMWDYTQAGGSPFNSAGITALTFTSANGGLATTIGNYAFYQCTNLGGTLTIPSDVTTIGQSAFNGCSSVAMVIIPGTIANVVENDVVTKYAIGQNAFAGLASGADIYYENSDAEKSTPETYFTNKCDTSVANCFGYAINATTTGHYIFHFKCGDNLWYTIQNGTATISKDIATGTNLATWKWIGSTPSPFTNRRSEITSISLSDVTTIDWYAFYNCTGVTGTLTIPNSVTNISNHAFRSCTGITQVTIPSSVTTIGYVAFQDCSSLAQVVIPSTVTNIGEKAFYGLASGADIYYTKVNGTNQVESDFVAICYGGAVTGSFTYDLSDSNANHYNYYFKCGDNLYYTLDNSGTLLIVTDPAAAANSDFTMWNWSDGNFADGSFYRHSGNTDCVAPNIVTVIVSPGVQSLGNHAFRNHSTYLTSVGSGYDNANNLLPLPSSVASMGASVFRECKVLANIDISNTTITSIGTKSFQQCDALTVVKIPSTTTSIGNTAFYGCDALIDVIIPANVNAIDTNAFQNTRNGTNFYCFNAYSKANLGGKCSGSTLTNSFNRASAQHFYFPCGDNLYYELSGTNGTTATISAYPSDASDKTMWNWDPNAAQDPTTSPFKTIQDNDTYPITTIVLGDATTVGTYAFNGCSSLTSVTIPNTITNIYGNAFKGLACTATTPSVTNVTYSGKQAAFEPICTTSVTSCFDYAVGASDYLLYHFTQDIAYVANDGTMPDPTTPVSYETNGGGSVVLATPTRDDYNFDGWCTDAALATTPITAFTADNTQFGDKTFYAKWTLISVSRSIIYYCQYGSIASPTVTEYTPGSGLTLTLDKPTRSGYAFCGWHSDVTLSNVPVTGGLPDEKEVSSYNDNATLKFAVADNTEDVSFYAQWYECVNVSYWNSSNDTQQTLSTDYEIVKSCETTLGGDTNTTYWYVLKDDVSFTEPLTVTGNVNLILKDGCSLDTNKVITVNNGEGTLTIYAQQSDAAYNAPIDEEHNTPMQFNKFTERTTKQSFTLSEKTYYLDSATSESGHYALAYDKSNGNKYLVYYAGSNAKVMVALNTGDTFSTNASGNLVYNGTVYTYDSTQNKLKNSEDDSYLENMITSPSSISIITNSSWNPSNPSFCYYTQDNNNYYENSEHVLVDETNGNTPTSYHFDAETSDMIGYTTSTICGKLSVDVSATSNVGDACIGGDAGHMNGNITINGGEIDLKTNGSAACIGSGDCSELAYQTNSGQINIYGGEITATNYYKGANKAANIGGGYNSSGGTITISGGRLTLVSSDITIGAGKGGVKSTNPNTTINLNWKNKTDYIDSQCGGFDSENTKIAISVAEEISEQSATQPFIYQRRGSATASEEGGVVIASVSSGNDNLSTNKNFKIIPYFDVDYTLVYPMSGVVLPFKSGTAYAFGCDTTAGTKGIGICTQKDDPATPDVDETCTVVKPYCLSLTTSKNILIRVKNYITVDGVRQAVYYTSEESGYDSINFDIVEITTVDEHGQITETGDSINDVRMLFVGGGYNYNSGRESAIDGVKDEIALKFGSDTLQSKKPGIYQGSVSFTTGVGIIEDENVNQWAEFFNS